MSENEIDVDAFWGRLLGDDDPCAPGKDWVSAAFTESPVVMNTNGAPVREVTGQRHKSAIPSTTHPPRDARAQSEES